MTSHGFIASVKVAPKPSPQERKIFSRGEAGPPPETPNPTLQCRQHRSCVWDSTLPRPQEGSGRGPHPSAPAHLQPADSRLLTKVVTGTCPADADTIVVSLVTARKGTKRAASLGMPGGQLPQQALHTPRALGKTMDTCLESWGDRGQVLAVHHCWGQRWLARMGVATGRA